MNSNANYQKPLFYTHTRTSSQFFFKAAVRTYAGFHFLCAFFKSKFVFSFERKKSKEIIITFNLHFIIRSEQLASMSVICMVCLWYVTNDSKYLLFQPIFHLFNCIQFCFCAIQKGLTPIEWTPFSLVESKESKEMKNNSSTHKNRHTCACATLCQQIMNRKNQTSN